MQSVLIRQTLCTGGTVTCAGGFVGTGCRRLGGSDRLTNDMHVILVVNALTLARMWETLSDVAPI